jgi:hypothetical protein
MNGLRAARGFHRAATLLHKKMFSSRAEVVYQ